MNTLLRRIRRLEQVQGAGACPACGPLSGPVVFDIQTDPAEVSPAPCVGCGRPVVFTFLIASANEIGRDVLPVSGVERFQAVEDARPT